MARKVLQLLVSGTMAALAVLEQSAAESASNLQSMQIWSTPGATCSLQRSGESEKKVEIPGGGVTVSIDLESNHHDLTVTCAKPGFVTGVKVVHYGRVNHIYDVEPCHEPGCKSIGSISNVTEQYPDLVILNLERT